MTDAMPDETSKLRGEKLHWMSLAAKSMAEAETLRKRLEKAEAACEAVVEFWGSHEAWGDFATLSRAAVAFAPVADAARAALDARDEVEAES